MKGSLGSRPTSVPSRKPTQTRPPTMNPPSVTFGDTREQASSRIAQAAPRTIA